MPKFLISDLIRQFSLILDTKNSDHFLFKLNNRITFNLTNLICSHLHPWKKEILVDYPFGLWNTPLNCNNFSYEINILLFEDTPFLGMLFSPSSLPLSHRANPTLSLSGSGSRSK